MAKIPATLPEAANTYYIIRVSYGFSQNFKLYFPKAFQPEIIAIVLFENLAIIKKGMYTIT